jgi:hypothetical protein
MPTIEEIHSTTAAIAAGLIVNPHYRYYLHDYETGDELRPATYEEAEASLTAPQGVITVDGQSCYVE